jgi:hypothetical protein
MLCLMVRNELTEVGRAADLPAVVRATALELHELRPPMDSVPPPSKTH